MSPRPIPTADWTDAFLRGCAEYLDEQLVVEYVDDAGDGVHTGARPPLWLEGFSGTPDRAVALSVYPVDDDPVLADVAVGIQVVSRGRPDIRSEALSLDDAVYNVLHGARGLTWRDIPVVVVARRSGSSLGQDKNRRWEQVSNYWATAARPTPNRVD